MKFAINEEVGYHGREGRVKKCYPNGEVLVYFKDTGEEEIIDQHELEDDEFGGVF
jgi:hypothetical protein